MRSVFRLLLLAALPAALAVSCVSPKVHAELQSSYDQVVAENEALKFEATRQLPPWSNVRPSAHGSMKRLLHYFAIRRLKAGSIASCFVPTRIWRPTTITH
jgi:hypothetical protein